MGKKDSVIGYIAMTCCDKYQNILCIKYNTLITYKIITNIEYWSKIQYKYKLKIQNIWNQRSITQAWPRSFATTPLRYRTKSRLSCMIFITKRLCYEENISSIVNDVNWRFYGFLY